MQELHATHGAFAAILGNGQAAAAVTMWVCMAMVDSISYLLGRDFFDNKALWYLSILDLAIRMACL